MLAVVGTLVGVFIGALVTLASTIYQGRSAAKREERQWNRQMELRQREHREAVRNAEIDRMLAYLDDMLAVVGRSIVSDIRRDENAPVDDLEHLVANSVLVTPSISFLGISNAPYRDILRSASSMLRPESTHEDRLELVGEIRLLADSAKKELLDLKGSPATKDAESES